MSASIPSPANEWLSLLGCVDVSAVLHSVVSASHVWVVGLCIGMIFPRQKLLSNARGFALSALVISTIGIETAHWQVLGRVAMLLNGAIFIQSLWYRFTDPGTFHRLWGSMLSVLTGAHKPDLMRPAPAQGAAPTGKERKWLIDESDLDFFRARVERQDAPVRADAWEALLQKQIPEELEYRAFRRMLKDIRKTEYLSISITSDTSPQEVMDFYLADPVRQQWDNLLTTAEVVMDGDFQHRQQVVHWVRSFPFAFLSDRDYIIARQTFKVGETLYGISKVVKHGDHNPGNTVQMDQYWSMWSCKPVACPFGSGKIATETTLLHMEDFKIPENLGRFAVKAGMWGFVRKMSPYMKAFVQERRARGVAPEASDPNAFGAPVANGEEAAPRTVADQRGKKKGFGLGRFAVTVAASVVFCVLIGQRRRKKQRGKEQVRAVR